jgi:hypothetical protein
MLWDCASPRRESLSKTRGYRPKAGRLLVTLVSFSASTSEAVPVERGETAFLSLTASGLTALAQDRQSLALLAVTGSSVTPC